MYVILYYQTNQSQFPYKQAFIKKHSDATLLRRLLEADSYRFLRTRKNIEMVQTKHCDD